MKYEIEWKIIVIKRNGQFIWSIIEKKTWVCSLFFIIGILYTCTGVRHTQIYYLPAKNNDDCKHYSIFL